MNATQTVVSHTDKMRDPRQMAATARPRSNVLTLCATLVVASLVLVACGATEDVSANAEALPMANTPASPLLKRGENIFSRCLVCHAVDPTQGHKVGPNLHAVFGATVGSQEGFFYSQVLASADATWNETALDEFLTNPSEYFPGTFMTFAGLEKAQDRAAVIEYLKVSAQAALP